MNYTGWVCPDLLGDHGPHLENLGLVWGNTLAFSFLSLWVLVTNPGLHIFWASILLVLVSQSDFSAVTSDRVLCSEGSPSMDGFITIIRTEGFILNSVGL